MNIEREVSNGLDYMPEHQTIVSVKLITSRSFYDTGHCRMSPFVFNH